jgi:hypothetical protein
VRPRISKEKGREEQVTASITMHEGVMDQGLVGEVGVADSLLALSSATTSTPPLGDPGRDGGIVVAAFVLVSIFAPTPIPSRPSADERVAVGVLEFLWRPGSA